MDIGSVMILPFAILGLGMAFWYVEWRNRILQNNADREVERHRKLYHFTPDMNGNYPAYVNPDRGIVYRLDPGNPINPPMLLPPEPRQKGDRLLLVNPNKPKVRPVQPEPLEPELEPGFEPELLPERTERSEPVQDRVEILRTLKAGGGAKAKSIYEVFGVTKGGGQQWKDCSSLWDSLEI